MGCSGTSILLFLSWVLFASTTHQLKSYEMQILVQLRKHLEYPVVLDVWENYNGDLCNLSSSQQLSIKCENDSVVELRIVGSYTHDKVSEFRGFAIPNQTLSQSFSIDSFVTTLARLSNLKVLALVSLGIWGPLPDKIHRLYYLEFVDMSSNFLFGSIPFNVSRLASLETLIFDGNFLNDTLPEWLDSLTNLTSLRLMNNRLNGQIPSAVSRMKTLNEVVLSHNLLSGKVPDLSGLSSLQLLDLTENKLDSELPPLPNGLTNIFLSHNSFKGKIPEEFGKLNQLQHLDLSKNVLTGTPPATLFLLPNISYLNLSSNNLSGALPEDLKCGDALTLIDLSENKLSGQLPSSLGIGSDNRTVRIRGNCLSIVNRGQNPTAYCLDRSKTSSTQKEIVVLAGVISGIVVIVAILVVVGLLFFCRRNRAQGAFVQHVAPKVKQDHSASGISSDVLASARIISEAAKMGSQGAPAYKVFSVEELEEATNNFVKTAFLGESLLGKVYKGKLENGMYVAIRCSTLSRKHSIRNLKMRLEWLSKLNHPHLVGLLGHCINDGLQDDIIVTKLFLVYEFVPNGNFHSYLSETAPEKALKWPDRLSVLIGVAKAVYFLHTGVIPPSCSNRLKTNNILLDEHQIAKLSDFGMSIIEDEIEKTEEYVYGAKSRPAAELVDDVHDFGFILLEALVGPVIRGKEETFLLNEMTSFGSQDGRRKIVDPIVLTTSSQESLSIVVAITNKCISRDTSNRPSFEDVLWNLQYAAQVQSTADSDQKSDATSQSEHQAK